MVVSRHEQVVAIGETSFWALVPQSSGSWQAALEITFHQLYMKEMRMVHYMAGLSHEG